MKTQLKVKGMSQYSIDVHPTFQNSACGPTTVFVILNYLLKDPLNIDANQLYTLLGGTKIGLFKWRLIKNLQKLLGPNWNVSSCSLAIALKEIDAGRPLAMKFDKYFTFQWHSKPTFKYHWVPLIGYEIEQNELHFFVHDNGGPNRDSQIRKVPYAPNSKVIRFVKIEPK
ncbi:C39 family peptidase [Ureibacillus sp. 179-F W5.1 NHS]|uniref:C39 family peptidase n=1 Tax=Ureibacillus sp. 179-F W5.1 NHS TaxID=3374297 RepID=UPI00387914F8